MEHKFIAYEGEIYTIEWYYDSRGKSHAKEYYLELSRDQQKKFARLLITLGDSGKIYNTEKFRYEEDKIYEFKPKPDRFLCFFYQDSKVIISNAFEKKTDKMPPQEKQKALKAREDYINRCMEGSYYEETT